MTSLTREQKLHVGCGQVALAGWTNIDNQPLRGVDRVLDVTQGFPFRDVAYIFAEHFIEHLSYEDAAKFLTECRRSLRDDGVLRLSTPNLDWVWMTHYHRGAWSNSEEQVRDCFNLNKAFRGWGHQFLYNLQTLRDTLLSTGFAEVELAAYGESRHPSLRGLERHETYADDPDLPHILVVEAHGRSSGKPHSLDEPLRDFREAVSAK
ncbi:MAG: hypothetical protein ABI718_18420 [Acidobacteriota bacterium]